jgi:hypothetical protein
MHSYDTRGRQGTYLKKKARHTIQKKNKEAMKKRHQLQL